MRQSGALFSKSGAKV